MPKTDYAERDKLAKEDRATAAERWKRGYVQVRGIFVQLPRGTAKRASTLALLVRERQHRALLLYLMLLSVWPWLHDDKTPLESTGWMHLLHSRPRAKAKGTRWPALVWSESTLSRTWKYLESVGLVEKSRGKKGRLAVRPRLEDRSGEYVFTSGVKANLREAYFTIPDRFWMKEDFAKLSLPGVAVLLVILKETNQEEELRITHEQMADWYGFSRSTVQKGLDDLRKWRLVDERVVTIKAPFSKVRTTTETYYSLRDEYATEARLAAKAEAMKRRKPTPTTKSPSFTTTGGDEDDG